MNATRTPMTRAEVEAARILWPYQSSHDPGWAAAKGYFFVELARVGLRYDDLAAYCEALGLPHPSEDRLLRQRVIRNAAEVARQVRAWLDGAPSAPPSPPAP